MTAVLLRPLAEADLVERTQYYRRQAGDDTATKFFDSAIAALGAIGGMPNAGSPLPGELTGIPGLRARRIVDFPCAWFYFVTGPHVDAVRLLHDAQDLPAVLAGLEPA